MKDIGGHCESVYNILNRNLMNYLIFIKYIRQYKLPCFE